MKSCLQNAFLRRYSSVLAVVVVVVTLVTCVSITKAKHIYTGGLVWPYFSDTGRDAPGYYVFCVGLTVTAVLVALTYYFNYEYQSKILGFAKQIDRHKYQRVSLMSRFVCFCGVISVIGLPGLSIFDTSSYPTVHVSCAYGFFVFQVLALFFNTRVSRVLQRFLETQAKPAPTEDAYRQMEANDTTNEAKPCSSNPLAESPELVQALAAKAKQTFHWQMVLVVLFFIAFLVYIPVGLALPGTALRLTIEECLERHLGEEYCTKEQKLDATHTKLFNYERTHFKAQFRAIGQVCCVLTLISYSLTFRLHASDRVLQMEEDKVREQVTCMSNEPSI